MSRRSLERRLTVTQQAVAAALVVLFAGFSIWISASVLERQEAATVLGLATRLAASIAEEERETPDVRAAIADALRDSASDEARIQVYDPRGREVAARGRPAGERERRRTVRAAIPGGGWLVVSISSEPRTRAVLVLTGALLVTGVSLFLFVSAMSRTIARRTLRPLSRIASQAEGISWSGPVPSFSEQEDPAEILALSHAFDRLLERLHTVYRAEQSFSEDAAHELRTPVTVLCGEIEYAKQNPATPAPVRDALERALQQARGIADLVEALLLLRSGSQPEACERAELRQPVNLADLVRDLAWELRDVWSERVGDLDVVAEDEVLVAGHATLLASAVRNLIGNAFKFTSRGERIRVAVLERDGRASVVVEDGGPGIAPEDRERVFDPFFRSAESRAGHPGFGLGLPILKRVAGAHGGDIVLSQSPLGGARFEIVLPSWESIPTPLPA